MTGNRLTTPTGLILLGVVQLYAATRGIWNFFHHTDAKIDMHSSFYLALTVLCVAVAIGIMKRKSWAFYAFVIIYTLYILNYLGGGILKHFCTCTSSL